MSAPESLTIGQIFPFQESKLMVSYLIFQMQKFLRRKFNEVRIILKLDGDFIIKLSGYFPLWTDQSFSGDNLDDL